MNNLSSATDPFTVWVVGIAFYLRNWLLEWKGRQFKTRDGPVTSLDGVLPGNLSTVLSNRESGDSEHFFGGSGASGPSEANPPRQTHLSGLVRP